MIEVKNLTKRYGKKIALDDISFKINKGEILGFLGPNGAGKSTTMNIITGYLSTTDGVAQVGEYDILQNPIEAKRLIGYLPEQPPLYNDMTVKEYLEFVYELKGVKLDKKEHLSEICDVVKIGHVYQRAIKNLSKGYKQRVGLAQALLGNPQVLILDEPTVGLDPKQIIEIRNLIKSLGEKHTIILSSHILSEIQAVCDRIIVISNGKLVADDTTQNLASNLSEDKSFTVLIDGDVDKVEKALNDMANVHEVVHLGERAENVNEFTVEAIEGEDIRYELFDCIKKNDWTMLGLKSNELTLEDVFLKLTGGTL